MLETPVSSAVKQLATDVLRDIFTAIAANCELITRFDRKIQATLARIWGDEKVEG